MKKLLFGLLVALLPVSAWAIDTNVLAVVQDGRIQTTGKYFAFGGSATTDNPAFENRYTSEYSANGSAGFAQTNSFNGNISVKEQFEVMKGSGSFTTKAGTGVLINILREVNDDEETPVVPIVDGTARWNAGGFGGRLYGPGAVLSTFDTSNGLVGKSEAEMTAGNFKGGAIQIIEIGSNEQPIKSPVTIEYQEAHWSFDGKFQVKVEFAFPK